MTQRPRLLFLNRCYWPDVEATGQLLTDLCEDLATSFDVHVVCGQPNTTTSGESFEREECIERNGVTIHRLKHFQFPKHVSYGRIVNLISFYKATDSYLKKSAIDADVIISETDPFLLPLAGDHAAKQRGIKHICYLQDVYPDVAQAVGKSKVPGVARFLRYRLRKAYQRCDRMVVLGDCMRNRLATPPWGLSKDKIEVIPNWADCSAVRPLPKEDNAFREQHGLSDRYVVMHSGNMGLTQRLDVLLRATASDKWPAEAKLVLVGGGAAEISLKQLAQSILPPDRLADRIEFLPYRKRSELSESLSAADLHVVSMHENIAGCLCPSKLYGVLAVGRPVLAIAAPTTDLCQTVRRHDLGWCCVPGDPNGIAEKVAEAVQSPCVTRQQRARAVACREYDRPVVFERFRRLISDVTGLEDSLQTSMQSSLASAGIEPSPDFAASGR